VTFLALAILGLGLAGIIGLCNRRRVALTVI